MSTSMNDTSQQIVRHNHQHWLNRHPNGTLSELRAWLTEAHSQSLEHGSDDLPGDDVDNISEPLVDYLHDCGDFEDESFGHWAETLAEDIDAVEELILSLGEQTCLSTFPVLVRR